MQFEPNTPLDVVSEFVLSDEGDKNIAEFMDQVVKQAGDETSYTMLCHDADEALQDNENVIDNLFVDFLDLFWPYIEASPTGHGMSHLIQDTLMAMALYEDESLNRNIMYESDFWAGVVGGILHDIGNAVVPRYEDFKRRAGHAEVAAWRTHQLLESYIPESLNLLISYAIGAHTHYTKPVVINGKGFGTNNHDGNYHRPVYWYEDYVPGSDKWLTVGVVLVRAIDRMGTRGVTHMARHLLATADSVQTGVVGTDLTGSDAAFQVDTDSLRIHLLPKLGFYPTGVGDKKAPTVLQHVLNYQGGDLGKNNSPYGRNDGYLGVYRDLMIQKHNQTQNLIRTMVEVEPFVRNFSRMEALIDIKSMLSTVSRASTFNAAWETLLPLFKEHDNV